MILVLSSASPQVSLALFDMSGILVEARSKHAPHASSEHLSGWIHELNCLDRVQMFVADLGPGSFTGVRVAVTMANVFGWLKGRPIHGVSTFDLISSDRPVAVPCRKQEWLVRTSGTSPVVSKRTDLPDGCIGYGADWEECVYPLAERFRIEFLKPAVDVLVPDYVLEPSISTPKTPFRSVPNG